MRSSEPKARSKRQQTRKRALLAELVENATLFSPPHTQVYVRGEHVAHGFALEVEDRGVGIPAAELPRIFDRFYRGSNVAKRVSGSGIGLATVRSAVELLGGAVSARSTEGAGTTITVRLPLAD